MIITTNKRPHRHDIIDMTDKKDNLKKDRKSNLNHNATRKRYYYRQGRKLKPYFRDMMNETGIDLIFTGAKRADSIWRRRHTASIKKMFDNVKNPIYDWSKYEVLAYLKLKNIPIPDNGGRVSSGVDFSFSNLLFIYENYPEDFELMEKQFPFIRAVVKKREYFNGKL